MSNWSSKGVQLEPIEFDGDQVVFTVKRLLVEDMMSLSKYVSKADGVLRFENPLEVCNTAQTLVPKYVVGMSGLRNSEGVEMTIAEFVEASAEFYFVMLVGKLFAELVSVSSVRNVAKNSTAPSPASSAE